MATLAAQPQEAWTIQPRKGLMFVVIAAIAAFIFVYAVLPGLGLTIFDGTNYAFPFFFWAFALLSFFGNWPFNKLAQPWGGLLTAVLAWVLAVPSWLIPISLLGDPADPTVGPYNAFALISYALFFLFMLAWFYDTWPVAGLAQPRKGLVLLAISFVGGWVVYAIIGAIPQMWLYFIPMWLVPTALDYWPTATMKPYLKGTIWLLFVLVGTWLTNLIFEATGIPLYSARGSDFASIIFGGMVYMYTFEGWPFQAMKQPLKGVLLLLTTLLIGAIILPLLSWRVFNVADYMVGAWVFIVWVWLVIFQWLPYPWPSAASVEAVQPAAAAAD